MMLKGEEDCHDDDDKGDDDDHEVQHVCFLFRGVTASISWKAPFGSTHVVFFNTWQ